MAHLVLWKFHRLTVKLGTSEANLGGVIDDGQCGIAILSLCSNGHRSC